jgi:FkbM family methyltransferase
MTAPHAPSLANDLRRLPRLFRLYRRWFGLPRGAQILFSSLAHPHAELLVQPPGIRAPLALRPCTLDFFNFGQVFTGKMYALPLSHPPSTILDAGANIGLASVFFANRYPQAQIIALEPESRNFRQLCKNTAAYPQITPLQAALWDTPTRLDLLGRDGLTVAFYTQEPGQPLSDPLVEQVRALTLPQLLSDFDLNFLDLLKVDIEGAEKEVFAASAAWIDRLGVVVAELHDWLRRGCALSFYTATREFDLEWHNAEHVIVARREWVDHNRLPPSRLSR